MSLAALVPTPSAEDVASPLPLPTRGWGAAEALRALEEARSVLGAGPDATVVSALTTVVLRSGDHAVKVYPPGTLPAHLDRIAAALAGSRTAHAARGPALSTSWGVVCVSDWLPVVRQAGWGELGRLLRDFHDETAAVALPRWTPLSRVGELVADLPADTAEVLLRARREILRALDEVGSELGDGVIHGDVSPGNVVVTADGPRLIDLDWTAVGPREYDLASAARRLRSGEITAAEYADFCTSYGADVRSWPGLPLLDRVAELSALAFRLWDCRHHGRDVSWLDAEVARWRTPV